MKTRRFKYAGVGGPPVAWQSCKVIHKLSGEAFEDVVAANAIEGWFRRYAMDSHDKPKIDQNGNYEIERVEAEIEIVLHEGDPGFIEGGNCAQDIRDGVVFKKDLTAEEQVWVSYGMPFCTGCSVTPVDLPDTKCDRCTRREKRIS